MQMEEDQLKACVKGKPQTPGDENGDPNGNRTRAAAVKGQCPNR